MFSFCGEINCKNKENGSWRSFSPRKPPAKPHYLLNNMSPASAQPKPIDFLKAQVKTNPFSATCKVPVGDSPYCRAKHLQICGRWDEQISLLKHKVRLIQQGATFNGKSTKTARSHGRKFKVSIKQESSRLLGNVGWTYMQRHGYRSAEIVYRNAQVLEPDDNKTCILTVEAR